MSDDKELCTAMNAAELILNGLNAGMAGRIAKQWEAKCAEVAALRSSAVSAVEGRRDAIVQLIHKHVGVRQRVNVDLTGVEDAADAILRNLTEPQTAPSDIERAFRDACDEAGCAYDNEALLEAIHALKERCQAEIAKRPTEFLAWARETFGSIALARGERLMRFAEEAIELAHADGMERSTLDAITDRVYSREPGTIKKEIGQAQACLEMYAENVGESADALAEIEWKRVQSIPQEEWDRRHAAKQALGIALTRPLLSPTDKANGSQS